jgi:hypothetical protein
MGLLAVQDNGGELRPGVQARLRFGKRAGGIRAREHSQPEIAGSEKSR